MSFVKRDDVLTLMEGLFVHVFKEVMDYDLPTTFRRITYADAMNTYGTDKPDLRFAVEFVDMVDLAARSSFSTFREIASNGGTIKAVCAPKSETVEFSRKYITSLEEAAKVYGAHGLAWMKVGEKESLSGGVSKFFEGLEGEVIERMGAHEGDMILIVAHQDWKRCCASLSAVRTLGRDLNLIKKGSSSAGSSTSPSSSTTRRVASGRQPTICSACRSRSTSIRWRATRAACSETSTTWCSTATR